MPPPVDLTGREFGDLRVDGLYPEPPRRWVCRCVCGNVTLLTAQQLSGGRRTCGECPKVPRVCRVCADPASLKVGFCHTHGERWRRWGRPDPAAWAAAFLAGRLNICAVCGRSWNGYHGCRHCSPECLAEWKRESALARYYALDAEAKRAAVERALARGRARRRSTWVTARCVGCGSEFVGPPHRKTCGRPECRSKNTTRGSRAYRTRRAANEVAAAAAELQRRLTDDRT